MKLILEFLADLLMMSHACFSLFLIGGLVLILTGMILGWRWTRHRWFRVLHLAAALVLVARAWTGIPCPFSAGEDALRTPMAGKCFLGSAFHESFHRLAFRGNDPRQFI